VRADVDETRAHHDGVRSDVGTPANHRAVGGVPGPALAQSLGLAQGQDVVVSDAAVLARSRLSEAEIEEDAVFDPFVRLPVPASLLGGTHVAGFERVEEAIEGGLILAIGIAGGQSFLRALPKRLDLGFEIGLAPALGTHARTSLKS